MMVSSTLTKQIIVNDLVEILTKQIIVNDLVEILKPFTWATNLA